MVLLNQSLAYCLLVGRFVAMYAGRLDHHLFFRGMCNIVATACDAAARCGAGSTCAAGWLPWPIAIDPSCGPCSAAPSQLPSSVRRREICANVLCPANYSARIVEAWCGPARILYGCCCWVPRWEACSSCNRLWCGGRGQDGRARLCCIVLIIHSSSTVLLMGMHVSALSYYP